MTTQMQSVTGKVRTAQGTVNVRWMIRRDLADVVAFEADTPGGWDEAYLASALKSRNTIGMVAEVGGEVVGYMVYDLVPGKIVLRRISVSPDWRQQGIGKALLTRLCGKVNGGYRSEVKVTVPEEDCYAKDDGKAVVALLRSCGFCEVLDGDTIDFYWCAAG